MAPEPGGLEVGTVASLQPTQLPALQDKARGALLGLAVGDALGAALEFKPPGTFQPITDMVGGGPWRLEPGQWTDDTSMALCLAESLIERGGFDPRDQMERYLRWYRQGHLSSTGVCFDIGNTTARALHHFERTGEPYAGSTDPRSAGNGSIMRLAPVPVYYFARGDHETAIERAADSSRTTHGAAACIDACRYLAYLIVGGLRGMAKEELLSPPPLEFATPEVQTVANGSFKHRHPPAIRGSGYVVESLEAALWAFYHSDDFREGCLRAVNLGDDADTTGAVYGQLAGTYYGADAIPAEWRERLARKDLIVAYADGLVGCGR